ncbi:hypothetical protein AVEN_35375-1 [Araneus ventricosus]|uniref:Uncharacterized protein n=1 Tax=Araneus ventricosus TaxID=182803 RepID=A0A4Y2U0Z6_ARAVE|nr:hypothetical protein AVEN_35375-1 [Araneus ventricosus]
MQESSQQKVVRCWIGRPRRPCEWKGSADNASFPSWQALHKRSHKKCCSISHKGGESDDSSSDIDECSNSIKFTTPKEKKGEKSKKAKKDASQNDNNEQLDHTCDADVLRKECSENYYKTKRKCEASLHHLSNVVT